MYQEGARLTEIRKVEAMDNEMSVFKSFMRGLLRDLKELKKAIEGDDKEKAKSIIDDLIKDTQSGIED